MSYLLSKRMSCLSGYLVSSTSIQKSFCGSAQHLTDLLMNLVGGGGGGGVESPSYSFAILGPTPAQLSLWSNSSVQFSSVTQSRLTLCDPTDCSTPGLRVHHSRSLPKLVSFELVMPSNHLTRCHPLLSPSIFARIRVFSNSYIHT